MSFSWLRSAPARTASLPPRAEAEPPTRKSGLTFMRTLFIRSAAVIEQYFSSLGRNQKERISNALNNLGDGIEVELDPQVKTTVRVTRNQAAQFLQPLSIAQFNALLLSDRKDIVNFVRHQHAARAKEFRRQEEFIVSDTPSYKQAANEIAELARETAIQIGSTHRLLSEELVAAILREKVWYRSTVNGSSKAG